MLIMTCLGVNTPCIVIGMWVLGVTWVLKDIASNIVTWFQLPITLVNLK